MFYSEPIWANTCRATMEHEYKSTWGRICNLCLTHLRLTYKRFLGKHTFQVLLWTISVYVDYFADLLGVVSIFWIFLVLDLYFLVTPLFRLCSSLPLVQFLFLL